MADRLAPVAISSGNLDCIVPDATMVHCTLSLRFEDRYEPHINGWRGRAMELKDFVVSAITSLTDAVAEADMKIKDKGGMVNPGTHDGEAIGISNRQFYHPRTTLDFDIAISAASTKDGSAAVNAKIWVVEASIGGSGEIKNESVSRLTFSIDVVLPSDPKQYERVGGIQKPRR